jgi:hypothetical protein
MDPAPNIHESKGIQAYPRMRRPSPDRRVRLAVSIVAATVALLVALLGSPALELQAVDAPALKAKS